MGAYGAVPGAAADRVARGCAPRSPSGSSTILSLPRDPAAIRADAVKMRDDMARHKPPAGPLDIKLGPGGLVDLEFAVHTLQLTHHVGLDPRLEVALGALVEAGLIDDGADPDLRLLSRDAGRLAAGRARGHGAARAIARAGRERCAGTTTGPRWSRRSTRRGQRISARWAAVAKE